MADTFKTLKATAEGLYKEKMSKFISFAIPVESVEQAKEEIRRCQNKYCDARHVCWAYMLGTRRDTCALNDNGEPSSTAGKPILGQINSFGLTNILIVVVRYFGGIKLGTSGLIVAYRTAAADAIGNGEIVERHEMAQISLTFPYLSMNEVMKLTKQGDVRIVSQNFDNSCEMTVETRADNAPALKKAINEIEGTALL